MELTWINKLRIMAVGGLGILFIRKAADALFYRREAGSNLLSISKKI